MLSSSGEVASEIGGRKARWGTVLRGAIVLGATIAAIPGHANSLRPEQSAAPLGGTLRLNFDFEPSDIGRDGILYRGSSLGPIAMDGVAVPLGGRVREVARFTVTSTSMSVDLPVPDSPRLNGRAFCMSSVVKSDGVATEASNAVSCQISNDVVSAAVVPHEDVMGFESRESTSSATLRAVSFVDDQTGYLVGSSSNLLKTEDGGSNFDSIDVTRGRPVNLNDVEFVDANHGFVVGYSYSGFVYRTSNAGVSWESTLIPGKANACDFLDANTGFVVGTPHSLGSGGPISKTMDGGVTFTSQADHIAAELMDVEFASPSTGYAVGRFGTILRTIDGGNVWTLLDVPAAQEDTWFMAVEVLGDGSTAFFVGSDGVILATANGGLTFRRIASRTVQTLRSIRFLDRSNGLVTGDRGTLLQTFDGGATWVAYDSFYDGHPNTNLVLGVEVISSDKAFVVGYNGMFGEYGPFLPSE